MPSPVHEAIDRLYIAARRVQCASGADVPAAEENLEKAVREALRASVSYKKIQHITGFSRDHIHMLRRRWSPGPGPSGLRSLGLGQRQVRHWPCPSGWARTSLPSSGLRAPRRGSGSSREVSPGWVSAANELVRDCGWGGDRARVG